MEKELQDMLVQLLEGQTRIESEVKKNSIKLEAVEKNLEIIAEVQTSHKEQHGNDIAKIEKLINEKTDLIETAIKTISKDTKDIKESVEVLKDMTGRHEVDINILKRRPV